MTQRVIRLVPNDIFAGVRPPARCRGGRVLRKTCVLHRLRRGLLLRVPGSELRRPVVVAGAAVARINGGDENGGAGVRTGTVWC